MKMFKKISFVLLSSVFAFGLASCGKKSEGTKTKTTKKTTSKKSTSSKDTTHTTPTFDDEVALRNFVDKIEACNYKITGDDFVVNAYSDNLIWYDYERSGYNDFVVMSNEDETFQAFVKNNNLTNLTFVEYGQASDACSKEALSLKYITNTYGDNMFDLVYNIQEEDGVYVSYSAPFKNMIQRLGAYSDMVLGSMEEVYLTLDAENPTKATLKTHVFNAVSRYDFDIEINIEFGNAEGNELALAWLENPVMPADPPTWTNNQVDAIDFVFNLYQYEERGQAIPFIHGASYALYLDAYAAKYDDMIILQDKHMSEEDVNAYITYIIEHCGFERAIDEEDLTCYRLELRNESRFYSSLYVEYSDGLYLAAIPYYECDKFDNLSDINNKITDYDFVELPTDAALISTTAVDELNMENESYAYISQHNLVLIVSLSFDNPDALDLYLEKYTNSLKEAGFTYEASQADPRYTAHYEDKTVRFMVDYEEYEIKIKFKSNEIYTAERINNRLGTRFPNIPFSDNIERFSAKNKDKYDLIINNKDYFVDFEVDLYFEDETKLNAFLNEFVGILGEADYERDYGAGTGKVYEYINDDDPYGKKICGFTIMQSEVSTEIALLMVFIQE